MDIQSSVRLLLSLLLCTGSRFVHCDIASAGRYPETVVNSILDLYTGTSSSKHSGASATMTPDDSTVDFERAPIVPTHIYPYLLLSLWVTCITCIVCCCLYCKCQQADSMTTYNSNGFELREVHVQDHPFPHAMGCVCLGCLQRQVAKEEHQKREH